MSNLMLEVLTASIIGQGSLSSLAGIFAGASRGYLSLDEGPVVSLIGSILCLLLACSFLFIAVMLQPDAAYVEQVVTYLGIHMQFFLFGLALYNAVIIVLSANGAVYFMRRFN